MLFLRLLSASSPGSVEEATNTSRQSVGSPVSEAGSYKIITVATVTTKAL
jgi:hypothetical protein